MVFSSLTFILFFLPISIIGYYLLPKSVKNFWLLLVSLFFYAWGAHEFIFVMLLSIVFNYVLALLIDVSQNTVVKKLLLTLSVIGNLSILFYNKYMNLTTELLNKYVSSSIEVTEILLPIGISFFTFQAMSYVIDVYRKDTPVQKNFFDLALYISFFPQLVAGPIVRYRTIADQINERRTTVKQFCDGTTRFMSGFVQKILLSNTMSVIADTAFNNTDTNSVLFAWVGAIAYSLQILFDFSGYSSMAIGLGKMFGFEFMENFNYPYIATNVTDFWRRWHISLSQWFRDYVYFPLGGSRVNSKFKLFRNLFVVWLLTGIWHGANFTFVLWGLWYFVLLCFEKIIDIPHRKLPALIKILYRIFTLLCVVFGWVLFRATSVGAAIDYLKSMFGLVGNGLIDNNAIKYIADYGILFIIAFVFCTPLFTKLKEYLNQKFNIGRVVGLLYDIALVGCMLLAMSSLIMGVNNPFIYFNF